ncbi:MAG: carboxymuconolactone decarboxylase family protein [Ferrimicrobium sp.]
MNDEQHQPWHQVQEDLRQPAKELRAMIPEVLKAYGSLHHSAMATGEISTGTKELIALAVAVALKCDGCITSHARGAARAGVSRQAIAEALGVTILLTGGPGTVYGPRALEAFDEYERDYHPSDS